APEDPLQILEVVQPRELERGQVGRQEPAQAIEGLIGPQHRAAGEVDEERPLLQPVEDPAEVLAPDPRLLAPGGRSLAASRAGTHRAIPPVDESSDSPGRGDTPSPTVCRSLI